MRFFTASLIPLLASLATVAQEPSGELAKKLSGVKFEQYAAAPGYSEGPTWRDGDVFFCSGALLRVDAKKVVHKYLEINPAGTVRRGDGHLLVCDNRFKAILDIGPDGKAGVLADRFGLQPLKSLNDLTVDARGNIYWTDPENSSAKNPVGNVFRLRPDGRVDRIATGLAFPNGLDVDPASKFLFVIESQSQKVLRYKLPEDHEPCDKPEVFYDLGGSGGDGCAFDAEGNLWVADFHRPDTKNGRISVLSPDAKVLAYLPVPAKVVSNIAFGGPNNDEIFCTTGDPPGVFHAKVGVKGFAGHPGQPMPITRFVNVVPIQPHEDAVQVRTVFKVSADAKLEEGKFSAATRPHLELLMLGVSDRKLRKQLETLFPEMERAASQFAKDKALLAEIRRLGGTAVAENFAPEWLRAVAGEEALPLFNRIVEIQLNERSDGHKEPVPKKLSDRVTDDWLKNLAGQDRLRRLELSGTAVTSAGLVHLKELKSLEILNVCLTAVTDDGFENLSGLTSMRRMIVCSSKITGTGFRHCTGMTQLESINLHSSPASDAGLEAIGKLTSLKRVEIVHTNVTDAGLIHLANLKNLRMLHVASPGTSENALPFLAGLKELETLDVYEKAASDFTLQQIGKLPKLRSLMLTGGPFTDAGVKNLSNVTTLEELQLTAGAITNAGIEPLANLKHLRQLNLGGTKVTPAGRQKLANALPRLVIEK